MKSAPISPKTNHLSLITLHLLLAANAVFAQGSLTPPGAPAPTMKSLDQIASTGIAINNTNTPGDANYHFIIGAPGSYFLTGNLAVTKTSGIWVSAAGVTVDLNGFQISRSAPNGGDGITVDGAGNQCVIKNGSIASSFGTGVNCVANTSVTGGEFSHLAVSGCKFVGIRGGIAWRIENCSVYENFGTGIVTRDYGLILNCTAMGNSSNGISAGVYNNVQNCTSNGNGAEGISALTGSNISHCTAAANHFDGLSLSDQCNVTDCACTLNTDSGITSNGADKCAIGSCTVNGNSFGGISLHDASSVTHCTVDGNNSSGISVNNDCTIKDCTAGFNVQRGIVSSARCSIVNCTANGNGTGGSSDGINGGAHSQVKNCVASNNTGNGINVSSDSSVLETECNLNTVDGIIYSEGCLIRGNTASQNSHIGLHGTSFHNTVDGNKAYKNTGAGIVQSAADADFTTRNVSSLNTGANYSPVSTGAYFGQFTTPGAANPSPWANF